MLLAISLATARAQISFVTAIIPLIFFVLSGFVMAMTYGHDVQNAPTARSYLHFLARRLARIYPLYAIITIVTFLVFQAHLSTLAPVSHPVPTLALNLLMIQAWGFATSIVGPGWSISTEWGAYLLFPLLLAGSLAKSRLQTFLMTMTALALLLLIAYGPASIINGDQQARLGPLDLYGKSTLAPLCRCLASFTLGLLAFRWHHIVRPSCTTLVAGLLLLAMTFPGTDVLLVLLFTVLVMGLYDDVGFTARLLGSRIIHTTGVWSYSIYLLHPRFNPVKQFLMRTLTNHHLPPAIAVSAAIFLSTLSVIVCAAFTYRFIEKPARKALNSIKVCRLSQTAVLDEPGVRT